MAQNQLDATLPAGILYAPGLGIESEGEMTMYRCSLPSIAIVLCVAASGAAIAETDATFVAERADDLATVVRVPPAKAVVRVDGDLAEWDF